MVVNAAGVDGEGMRAVKDTLFIAAIAMPLGGIYGLLLGYLMYKSGLVPRGMAMLGLADLQAAETAGTQRAAGPAGTGRAAEAALSHARMVPRATAAFPPPCGG